VNDPVRHDPVRKYAWRSKAPAKAPSYDRVVQALKDAEVMEEIALGKGEKGYQRALQREAIRRGLD
jgi:hypothetical protein